jgi:hypothetical protein
MHQDMMIVTTEIIVVALPYAYYQSMMQRCVYPILISLGIVGNTLNFLVMNLPSNRMQSSV